MKLCIFADGIASSYTMKIQSARAWLPAFSPVNNPLPGS
jgi:hypothetical protein